MKILQINSVCGIRSTGRICTDIADILAQNGHDCKIAYGRETVPEKYKKYAVRIGSDLSVKIDALKSRIFDNAGFNSKSATKKFIKWVEEYDPDVIHLHNIHGYYINVEILFDYLKRSNKPVIWTLHDCWSFTGHCSHFDFAGCDKWKNLSCSNCPEKKSYPASLFCDNSSKNIVKKKKCFTGLNNFTIVTPSNWLADQVKLSYLKDYPIKVIYNGIDLNVFKPTPSDFRKKYGLEDKKIILGVASTWTERKGYNDFLKLSEILDDSFKIVLVGVSPKQLKTLPANILGITRTENVKQLAEIYTAADVFLNLTYEDTYPTVNLEAQACGSPVITYNTGGSAESVPIENVLVKGSTSSLLSTLKAYSTFDFSDSLDKLAQYCLYVDLYKEKQ